MLAERLATSDYDEEMIGDRLRDLQRGDWLVRPAAPFAAQQPQPFHVASPSLPAGHPESDAPLTGTAKRDFEHAFQTAKARTRDNHGEW